MSDKVKVDARAAAFIAAWDLAHKADDVIAEGKFACEQASSMLLKMADVYATPTGPPDDRRFPCRLA